MKKNSKNILIITLCFIICLMAFLISDVSMMIPYMQISTPDLVKTELITIEEKKQA